MQWPRQTAVPQCSAVVSLSLPRKKKQKEVPIVGTVVEQRANSASLSFALDFLFFIAESSSFRPERERDTQERQKKAECLFGCEVFVYVQGSPFLGQATSFRISELEAIERQFSPGFS